MSVDQVSNLERQLKLADRRYLDLKNAFDERVQEATNKGKKEGYEEATKNEAQRDHCFETQADEHGEESRPSPSAGTGA